MNNRFWIDVDLEALRSTTLAVEWSAVQKSSDIHAVEIPDEMQEALDAIEQALR